MAFPQKMSKEEAFTSKCMEEKFKKANTNTGQIISGIDELNRLISNGDLEHFKTEKAKLDSLFTICQFYTKDGLNYQLLLKCLESGYNPDKQNTDTTSTIYQLGKHLNYLSNNRSIIADLSPNIQIEALKLIITPKEMEKDIFKIYYFLVLNAVMNEFGKYAQSRKNSGENSSDVLRPADPNEEVTVIDNVVEFTDLESEDVTPYKKEDEPVFIMVEKMPSYPGGNEALMEYLKTEPKHPDSNNRITGKIYIQFTIDQTGKVTNPRILRGLSPEYDKEALRVINNMPDWIPGEQNGKKVKVVITKGISFE